MQCWAAHAACKVIPMHSFCAHITMSASHLFNFNSCILALVGQLGTQQLGAVSVGSLSVSFCTFLFSFLLFLTTPEIAGAVAMKDKEKVSYMFDHSVLPITQT